MGDQIRRKVPQNVIESLDASVRDIAEGRLHDALIVQTEALQMLSDHERAGAAEPSAAKVRRARSSS